MLTDLAEVVRDFTEPRRHTEIIESRDLVVSRTGRTRSRLVRSQYVTMFPPMLVSLKLAAFPSSADMGPSGAFESQSPANDAAIAVLIGITTQAADWCWRLRVKASTDRGRMMRLVSARHTDTQLADLTEDARRWRNDALMVTGEEEPSRVINQPCPMCAHRNVLVMRGDGGFVKCRRCEMAWDESSVGLLAQMLANNRTHETLSALA